MCGRAYVERFRKDVQARLGGTGVSEASKPRPPFALDNIGTGGASQLGASNWQALPNPKGRGHLY
jgi:hypothetical protein